MGAEGILYYFLVFLYVFGPLIVLLWFLVKVKPKFPSGLSTAIAVFFSLLSVFTVDLILGFAMAPVKAPRDGFHSLRLQGFPPRGDGEDSERYPGNSHSQGGVHMDRYQADPRVSIGNYLWTRRIFSLPRQLQVHGQWNAHSLPFKDDSPSYDGYHNGWTAAPR